jgi:Tol biopolymer transport system component
MRGSISKFWVAVFAGLMVLMTMVPLTTAAAKVPSLMVDGRPVTPAPSLRWEKETVLISLKDLSTCLNAGFEWNEAEKTTWIQKYGRTIFFRLTTGEVKKNSQPITAPVPVRLIDGTVYVPLRFVVENLGATVVWDGTANQVNIITGERHTPPERISGQAFNALVAYTDQGKLWLLDGRETNSQPKQLFDSGLAELVGWSADGTWLAYKYYADAKYDSPAYLWVVQADGSGARQVDTEPVYGDPEWSPKTNRLAYTIEQNSADGYVSTGIVRYADITAEKTQVHTLVEEDVVMIPSFTWYPDGESLVISFPRTKEQPPRLERVGLTGQRSLLYTLKDETPIDPEGLYFWAFISLKWSPDGRYLAYHLRMNSGSLTADSVETGVLDTETKQTYSLGGGLRYPQWLAFSPDSKKLAYIAGGGRDVILNKQLEIADLSAGGQVIDYSQSGYVDTQPVWLPGETNKLLFCRGPENEALFESNNLPGVIVPGQRIYKLSPDGPAAAITAGPTTTADYYPSPSPSGKEMIFLRLERFNQGSLYLQPLTAPEKAVEVLRGLGGSPGYYYNYYPEWISVYWLSEAGQ